MPKYLYSELYENGTLQQIRIPHGHIPGVARAIALIDITKKKPEYRYRDVYEISIKTDLCPARYQPWNDNYKASDEIKAAYEALHQEFHTIYKHLTNCLIYNGWQGEGNFVASDIKTVDIGKVFTALHFIDPFDSETLSKITAHFKLELDDLYDVIEAMIERDGNTSRAMRVLSGISHDDNAQFFSFAAYFEKEWPDRPQIAIEFYRAISILSPLYQDAQRKVTYLQCLHSNTQADSPEKQFADLLAASETNSFELMYLFQVLCGHNPYVKEFETVGANAETIIKLTRVLQSQHAEISALEQENKKLKNEIAADERKIGDTSKTNAALMESVLAAQSMFKTTLKGLNPGVKKTEEVKKVETPEFNR